MKKAWFPLLIITLLFHCCALEKERVNIILVLADDLGYMDLPDYAIKLKKGNIEQCYYETPNLSRLINESVVFTQAYANPLCSPTRASIITGKSSSKLGFMTATPGNYKTYYNQGISVPQGFHAQDGLFKSSDRPFWPLNQGITNIALAKDEITIAEALHGYNSSFLGKWHLGGHGSKGFRPSEQGFDEIAWFDAGGSPYFNWKKQWNKKKKRYPKMEQNQLECGDSGQDTGENYLTDDLASQASLYIQTQSYFEKPFFLYYCPFAVHTPLQGKADYIKYFQKKPTKGWNGHKHPTYAAMLKSLDDAMGKIISTLESTGQLNNTVIIFMSDNGGIVHPDENGEPKISNNAPLKGEKALLYEGGVRVPLFIWQPKKWKHSTCNIAVDCTDIFPTVLDLAKKDLSSYKTFGDGQSLLPLLSDPQNSKRTYHKDTIHWHYPFYVGVGLKKDEVTSPRSAIRKDDWKLILNWEGQLELYNIKDDMFETRELSKHQPEKTRELLKSLVQWINRTVEERYIPMQNPKYNESLSNARSFRNIFEEHGLSWPKGRSSRVTDLN